MAFADILYGVSRREEVKILFVLYSGSVFVCGK